MSKRKVHHESLKAWLDATKQTPRDAAPALGVSVSYLYYILEGKRKPGRKLLSRMTAVGIDPLPFLEAPRAS